MADVKWIKLYVDILGSKKLKQIRKMPDGFVIAYLWFGILCLAGSSNEGGFVYFTKDIPYTDELLANEFDIPVNTVRLSLELFKNWNMIDIVNDVIYVSNWEKYQSEDKLEKIREQNRLRQLKFKESQKNLVSNVTVTLPVTQGNATELEQELDKEIIDKSIIIPQPDKKSKEVKHKHGEYNHVLLTDEQYQKLIKDYGETQAKEMIKILDEYYEVKGCKDKNHNLVLRKWVLDKYKQETCSVGYDGKKSSKNTDTSYNIDNISKKAEKFFDD